MTFEFYDKLKPVVARFDQSHASTDGGTVLLKALDDRLRLTDQLAACLADRRAPEKIRHSVRDLLRQRIIGIACGYEDGNDAARLADDPLHKLAVGRTSCSRFWANQFRVPLTTAAYVLLQELRRRAQGTACATAQVTTLRERLLKLAVWVEWSVRRLVLPLPQCAPWGDIGCRVAVMVGATPG